jgi:hypothetical protein
MNGSQSEYLALIPRPMRMQNVMIKAKDRPKYMTDLFEQYHYLWWYVLKGTHQAASLYVDTAKNFCTLVGSLQI